jgi:site-specific DNA recombinase
MLGDQSAISLVLEEFAIDASRLPTVLKSCRGWIERLRSAEAISPLNELIERIEISREGFNLSLGVPLPLSDSGRAEHVSLIKFVPMEIRRRGVEMKMVLEGDATPARVDLPLLKAIARARRWSNELIAGTVASVDELAKREHLDRRSVRRLIRLGFLAPMIVEAIAKGRQPPELTVFALARRLDLPTLWSVQEVSLGIR